jgi:orotidine-5'-phosphate decarboxylase
LTSNKGADDFQFLGKPALYQQVIKKSQYWASPDELMFVAGATRASMIAEIRDLAPDNFLLVPGVGAQGGSLEEVAKHGMNSMCGLLVNSSRGIIYAGSDEHFAKAAALESKKMANQMSQLLDLYCK